MAGTLARVHRCKTSWCDLDLTFDLAVVILTYNALSGPQVLSQLHVKACIATSVYMGNIQNIQTIIRPYK